jgi:hypothetical protein
MRAGVDDLTVEFEQDGFSVRSGRWGDMHVAHYTLPPGTDLGPFFAVLPDGLCSSDHFGVILEGEITLRYRDGSEETARSGDLYFWPAGHTAWTDQGAVFVAVSPLAQIEHIEERLAAAAG